MDKSYSTSAIRFFFLQAHYGSTLDLSMDALQAAEKGLKRIQTALKELAVLKPSSAGSVNIADWKQGCYEAMNDDFNCPVLVAQLFEGVKMINGAKEGNVALSESDITEMKNTFQIFFFDILGLEAESASNSAQNDKLEGLMNMVLEMRMNARAKKDFATSDLIRDRLSDLKIIVKDGKEGTSWDYLN
jgi:cysteinyl-tRNA synthetase